MEQHIPKGIEANYFEVEKPKDGAEDVTAKAGGEKGKMSILNTIKASPKSKDYHLKDEKEGESNDALVLDEDFDLGPNDVMTLFEVSKEVARLIIRHIPYKRGDYMYNTILKEMKTNNIDTEANLKDWTKSKITNLYDNKKIRFKSIKPNNNE